MFTSLFDDESDAERARSDARRARWMEVRGAKKGTTFQDEMFRVEHVSQQHPRGQEMLCIGPYNHIEMWRLPSWNDQPGVDADSGRHMPLHYDPDFERYPTYEEFFGFGSMESLDRWFCPRFHPWLKKNLFVVRRYIGRVETGYHQAVMNIAEGFKLDSTVLYYADR